MTPANLLRDCSLEIAARGHARLASVQSQIPTGTVISIAFLPGDTLPILVPRVVKQRRTGTLVRNTGRTPGALEHPATFDILTTPAPQSSEISYPIFAPQLHPSSQTRPAPLS